MKGILIIRSHFHNPFSLHGEKCVAERAHCLTINGNENARILYENRDL